MLTPGQTDLAVALTPESLVSEIKHLPSAPSVLPRLKRLLQDPNASIPEIVQLIRVDPSIALRVLHVANTAYFSRGERCATVDAAVQRIGFEHVYGLVAYAVASQVLIRPLASYGLDSEELWLRSVTCALAAGWVAEQVGEESAVAYTFGLLHAVGMVAIDEWAVRHQPDLRLQWSEAEHEYTASEQRQLGFTQAEAGAALLRTWEFPPEMWAPIQWQYAPLAASVQGRLAAVLCAARWLRTAALRESAGTLPAWRVLRAAGLTGERLRDGVAQVRHRLSAVRRLIQLPPETGNATR